MSMSTLSQHVDFVANKSGVKRRNTLGHVGQYMAHGRIVEQSR